MKLLCQRLEEAPDVGMRFEPMRGVHAPDLQSRRDEVLLKIGGRHAGASQRIECRRRARLQRRQIGARARARQQRPEVVRHLVAGEEMRAVQKRGTRDRSPSAR